MSPYQEAFRSTGRLGGKYLGRIFGFFFIFLFIIIPVMYALTISIQAGNVEPGLSYLSPKLVAPVQSLGEQSLMIVAQGGTYIKTGYLFKDIGNFLLIYWTLLGAMYIIYKWISILARAMPLTPFSNNTSAKMTNIVLAITIFIIIQMIFLGYIAYTDELDYWDTVNTPFTSVWNFAKAFPFLITEVVSIIDPTLDDPNNVSSVPPNETINNETLFENISIDTSKGSLIIY